MSLANALVVSRGIDPVWLEERELTRDRWDPEQHAIAVFQGNAYALCASNEHGRPLMCGGLMGGPGVLHTFMFGAIGWESVAGEATRAARRMVRHALSVDGVHRIQCISLCQHPQGRRFLEAMGLTFECELRGWGKHGESFFMFARTRED